jgi:hypothetical protein
MQSRHTPPRSTSTTCNITAPTFRWRTPRVFANNPLTEPADATAQNKTVVNITYWGATRPPAGVTATLTTSDASGSYKCTKSTITRKVGAYIEGQATFTLAPTPNPGP